MLDDPRSKASTAVSRWHPVYEGLREAIISRRIAPGTKLPEDELGGIYEVSRTVVRAALQALAQDRLIRLEPNRGAFVAQPSRKEAREVFEARGLIEPKLAAMAACNATPDDVAMLREHLARERTALDSQNDSEAISRSARFHILIAQIADQSVLTDVVADLVSHSSLIIALYWAKRETTCRCDAHGQLVEAIAAADAETAASLMKHHIADLLEGLDLSLSEPSAPKLADMLRSPRGV
jgi:DNA-binding GntR family transcriptional regulator